jgi:hypothetical protein
LTEELEATTPQVDQPGNKTKPTEYRPHEQWDPVFHDDRLHPTGWQCPCGYGVDTKRISCPKCGLAARGTVPLGWRKLDGSQRCTTGRQGRDYKRLAKRRGC